MRGTTGAATTPGRRGHFPPLDGLRGVAILLVVASHSFSPATGRAARALGAVAQAGWAGVNVFFVLSGFLITGILLDTPRGAGYFRNFYARRALRILPLFYAYLGGLALLQAACERIAPGTSGVNVARIPALWLHASNMMELWPPDVRPIASAQLWSLAVEEQVYLAWPLLVFSLSRRRLAVAFAAMFPAAMAFRAVAMASHLAPGAAYTWAPANMDAFAAGGLAALAVRSADPARWAAAARLAGGLAAPFLAGLAAGQRGFQPFGNMPVMLTVGVMALSALGSATIVASVLGGAASPLNRALSRPWLVSAGKYSYAMYLFHVPISFGMAPALALATGRDFAGSPGFEAARLVATFALSYAAAFASWHLFESHFLKLKSYFPTASPIAPPAVATADDGPSPGPR